jgi:hypothetical protein
LQFIRSNSYVLAEYWFKTATPVRKRDKSEGPPNDARSRANTGFEGALPLAVYSFKLADYSFFDSEGGATSLRLTPAPSTKVAVDAVGVQATVADMRIVWAGRFGEMVIDGF